MLIANVVGALAILFLFYLIWVEYRSCDGTLVRGLFWFECIR